MSFAVGYSPVVRLSPASRHPARVASRQVHRTGAIAPAGNPCGDLDISSTSSQQAVASQMEIAMKRERLRRQRVRLMEKLAKRKELQAEYMELLFKEK